jgi:hypothetical protein
VVEHLITEQLKTGKPLNKGNVEHDMAEHMLIEQRKLNAEQHHKIFKLRAVQLTDLVYIYCL